MITLTKTQHNIDKIKALMWQQTLNHPLGMPQYFGTLFYRHAYDKHLLLTDDDKRKRWDINSIRRTHAFINKLIWKTFGRDVPVWWMIERHRDFTDDQGNTKKGMYHSHFYVGSISDDAIENPTPYLMPLFYKEDDMGVPIDMRAVDLDGKKLLLLNACIRQAKYVGNHPASLKLDAVPAYEMERTFYYGLEDFNSNMDDMLTTVDWENSSFYKPTTN